MNAADKVSEINAIMHRLDAEFRPSRNIKLGKHGSMWCPARITGSITSTSHDPMSDVRRLSRLCGNSPRLDPLIWQVDVMDHHVAELLTNIHTLTND